MNQPSISFQDLFNAALLDYETQTGEKLMGHQLANELETCKSVESIHAILKKQVQISRKFRRDDGKIMKLLKPSVDVLYELCSTVLGAGIGLTFPPAIPIFAAIAILLAAVKDSASFDALIDLFASFESFLSRLRIYTKVPSTPALTDVLVKIIVELLYMLALATKQVKHVDLTDS
ncbi:hypothetical protein BJV77DRAFT_240304 [Russula vinacea]|nr:hypothetical protein BJV77DRAFT_240304 [Russula vinacea]